MSDDPVASWANPGNFHAVWMGLLIVAVVLAFALRRESARSIPDVYLPRLAWLRAGVWFCACFFVGGLAGIPAELIHAELAPPSFADRPQWWVLTLLVCAQGAFAYLWLWPRGTVTHGRPRRLVLGVLFGSIWGLSQATLMLSIFMVCAKLLGSNAWAVLPTFLVIAMLTGVWHGNYWDKYVAPDHNVTETNLRKILLGHAPFLLLTLLQLGLFGNPLLFVFQHVAALVCSTLAMRFPAPWDPAVAQHRPEGRSRTELSAIGLRR